MILLPFYPHSTDDSTIIIIIIIMSFTANIDNENNGGEINDNMNGWQTTLVVQE